MGTNYKKCNRKTHYRVRRGIIVKYSTCARAMWRRCGGGLSVGRRELGAVGAGRGGARRRCGWRGCLVWRLSGLGSGSGLRAARLSCRCAASRSGSGAGGQVVRLGSRLHLGRRGSVDRGQLGRGGCWSAGQTWAAQPCARSGCPVRSRWACWAALWARLHLGAAIGRAVRVARLCAAVRGLQWARLNRLQLARGREYVCNAFKRLLDAFCGCGGVLVRVDAVNGLEREFGALTRGRGARVFLGIKKPPPVSGAVEVRAGG